MKKFISKTKPKTSGRRFSKYNKPSSGRGAYSPCDYSDTTTVKKMASMFSPSQVCDN